MNFTGQYKKARHINLGGRNSASLSKENVLKRAQQDRERRQRLRKEENAATIIQSFFRSRIDVYESRLSFEKEWNQAYLGHDFEPPNGTDSPKSTNFQTNQIHSTEMLTEDLIRFIIQFNYFFPYTYSASRLNEAQINAVFQTIQNNISQFRNGKIKKTLISSLIKSFSSVLQKKERISHSDHHMKPIQSDSTVLSILELLQDFSETQLLPTCSKYIQTITNIDNHNISRNEFYLKYPHAKVVCNTLLKIVSHELENNEHYTGFYTEFLATPGLHIVFKKEDLQECVSQAFKYASETLSNGNNDTKTIKTDKQDEKISIDTHHFGPAVTTGPFGGSGFGTGVSSTFGGKGYGSSFNTSVTSVFGDFGSSFNSPNFNSEPKTLRPDIIDDSVAISEFRCVWRLANFLYFFDSFSLRENNGNEMLVSYQIMDILLRKVQIPVEKLKKRFAYRIKKLANAPSSDEQIEVSIDNLYKNKFIIQELDYVVSRDFFNTMAHTLLEKQVDENDVTLISLFSSIVSASMLIYPAKQQFIILYVTLSPLLIIRRLWNTFTLSSLYQTNFAKISDTEQFSSIVEENAKSIKLLFLFLEIYSYWLIVANDDEFYGSQTTQGLPKEDVKNLARFLRDLCYTLIWRASSIQTDVSLNNVFNRSLNMSEVKDSPESSILKLNLLRPSQSTLGTGCIMVMRQIYARDSRRKFLDDDFWIMAGRNNVSQFVNDAVRAEKEFQNEQVLQTRQNSDDSDDDSDSDLGDLDNELDNFLSKKYSNGAPCLELLRQAPFLIPFDTRLRIFQELVDDLKSTEYNGNAFESFGPGRQPNATIRRDHLLEDAFNGFDDLGSDFRQPISIRFVGEFGLEAGIGPGVTKEFLTVVTKEAFVPNETNEFDFETKKGLFIANHDQLLYPNPILGIPAKLSELSVKERNEANKYMTFYGKIIGKCIYENILVNVNFAPFFLQKWQQEGVGYRNSFDDLYSLDPELYSNLIKLYNYPGDVESDLMLDFTVTQEVGHGIQKTIELKSNGSNIPVTNSNRLEYIHAVANFKLNSVLRNQTLFFLKGLATILPPRWLSMFNARETQMLISGKPSAVDISDLKRNTILSSYDENDPTIQYFWEVLDEMSEDDKHKFIKFVTSVSQAPLLGFGSLNPKFAIRFAGDDSQRLPTSSTCVNLLKLPRYKSKEELQKKLLEAVRSDAGFELS